MHKLYRAQQTVLTCMLRIHKPYTLRVGSNFETKETSILTEKSDE
jgi:hypothetical protein